jgi:hypothetical protein
MESVVEAVSGVVVPSSSRVVIKPCTGKGTVTEGLKTFTCFYLSTKE